MMEVELGHFSVTCIFKNTEDGFQWAFTGVYNPVERSKSELLWEELGSVKGLWEGPWCIGGDFNMVLSPNERNRGGGGGGRGAQVLSLYEAFLRSYE